MALTPRWWNPKLLADLLRSCLRKLGVTSNRSTRVGLGVDPDRVTRPLPKPSATVASEPALQLSPLDHRRDYHTPDTARKLGAMRERFSLNLERVEDGWVQVQVEEYPEVITVGRDAREARLMALDALREYLASFRPGEAVPRRAPEESLT